MKKGKKPLYEAGDVVRDRWGNERLIIAVSKGAYLFVSKRQGEPMFFDATHSAAGTDYFEKVYKKVGVIKDLGKLIVDVERISKLLGEGFALGRELLTDERHGIQYEA